MIYDVEGLGLKHLWKPAIETFGEVRRPDNSGSSHRPVVAWHHPVTFFCITRSSRCLRKTTPKAWKDCLSSKVNFTAFPAGTNAYWLNNCNASAFSFILQPLKSSLWRTTSSSTSWVRTRDRRSLSSGVRHLEPLLLSRYPWGAETFFPWLLGVVWLIANWQEVLLKHIDVEELPVIYGGKLTDPDGDPRCRTRVSRWTRTVSWT